MLPWFARIWPSMFVMRAVFATVALVSQLALGSLALPDPAAATSLAQLRMAMTICKSIRPVQATPAHQQRHPVQGTCPLDVALELPAVILTPDVILPLPRLPTGSRLVALPPARAPPSADGWAPRARGPPHLA